MAGTPAAVCGLEVTMRREFLYLNAEAEIKAGLPSRLTWDITPALGHPP